MNMTLRQGLFQGLVLDGLNLADGCVSMYSHVQPSGSVCWSAVEADDMRLCKAV